ncbi:MAG: porin family protein [Geobacteraceae bacterium]|nr:porin family protein [Geobacteraceae bacterium]
MTRKIFSLCLAALLVMAAGTAMADSIQGRLGVTGRVGFLIPADSDLNDLKLETNVGLIGGGGLIFGITRNLAAELEITRMDFSAERVSGRDEGDFGITNIAIGAQYRFMAQPQQLVPYAGAGLDILLTDYERPGGFRARVDDMVGIHLCGGVDYFFMKQMAATAEVRAVLAPEVDINLAGGGNFDPSGVSTTFGIRVFFN